MLILFLIACIAIFPTINGQDIQYSMSPDVGEVSSGSYGETATTYSSSDSSTGSGYSAYPNTAIPSSPSSFTTLPRNTQPQSTPSQAAQSQTSTTSTAALTFQAPQSSDQQALLAYNILTNQPDSVFFNQVMLPWQTFVSSFPKNVPAFWVNTQAGWQWYATCPLGGWAQEIMFIPQTGTLGAYEIYPGRTTKYYSYGYATPGYHYVWFNGDSPGRHTSIITVDNMPSNAVVFDVI